MIDKLYQRLRALDSRKLVLVFVLAAVAITDGVTCLVTLILWQRIIVELLVLGTVNAILVPLLLAPLLINLAQSRAHLEERNRALSVENVERRRLEEQARLDVANMAAVNQLAVVCAAATPEVDLYVLIAEKLRAITKAYAVLVSPYDAEMRALVVRHVTVEGNVLQTVNQLLGRNLIGFETPVDERWHNDMLNNMVVESEELYDLALGALPRPVAALVQKTFGIGKIVGLAFVYAGELFGTAMIVMPSGQPSISRDLAKTLAHVGAVSWRRHQLERERAKLITELSAKNNELEHFTYTVSHDLKAPLLTIRGFLTFLQKDVQAGDTRRIQDDLQYIDQATVKMQRLLNELLELSRIGRMMRPPQRISFEEVAREAVSLTQGRIQSRNVRVSIHAMPDVYGDHARLVQVLQNLIDNAVKFMGDQSAPAIEIGTRGADGDGKAIFFVNDNGMGIDVEFHGRVFGLFNKLLPDSEGTGVGLALVRRIIEVHGGKIWIESEGRGKGTTFCFTLPLAKMERGAHESD